MASDRNKILSRHLQEFFPFRQEIHEGKVAHAIDLLREYETEEGYIVAFSGGKDSCVIKSLCDEAGVKYEAIYRVTGIDPPPLIKFIREHHADVRWERPEKGTFLTQLRVKGFPLGFGRRWCCSVLKHPKQVDKTTILGVRAEESERRAREWQEVVGEAPPEKLLPIFTWSDDDVWHYIRDHGLPYCCLYDEGWGRLGCLLCPLAPQKNRKREAERFPSVVKAYIKAFEALHRLRTEQGKDTVKRWKNGEEMFWWWMGDGK